MNTKHTSTRAVTFPTSVASLLVAVSSRCSDFSSRSRPWHPDEPGV